MFKIVTDSTADLPVEYLKEHDLGCMNLSYIMDGVTYGQGQELPEKEFYALMRQGKMPTTSQVNPEEAKAHFTEYLKENKEILCIAFSSGLSGTYNSMRIAADEIMELLLAVNRRGNTVLLVTHERRYADLCGRKIEISDGRI